MINITYKAHDTVPLDKLEFGQFFTLQDRLYIKVDGYDLDNFIGCFNIQEGRAARFGGDTLVTPHDVSIIVEN